jgi:hypothetical protein
MVMMRQATVSFQALVKTSYIGFPATTGELRLMYSNPI